MNLLRSILIFVKRLVLKLVGSRHKDTLTRLYAKIKYCVIYPIYQYLYVVYLKHKKEVNVVFIASSLSMWRYQRIYELLAKHSRFKVSIVINPFSPYSQEQQEKDVMQLKSYFDSLSTPYYVGDVTIHDVRKELSPDILFYPQPYDGLYNFQYTYYSFRDKLICYIPYGFWMSTGDWSYNMLFHNCAWKLFYSTDLHRKDATEIAYNKGRNVEVVGYPNADLFLMNKHQDVWKQQAIIKKRIIWAPHFTIFFGGYVNQSNFLWMADFMLHLTEVYRDTIQFVFKPHPRLKSDLYRHEGWGKDRADRYYEEWATRENTQLEEGEFIDLFMTSDAMIHDSGSFCVEYHYSKKPVMYVANNFEQQVSEKGEFGQLAMRLHYVGKCKEDIIHFIEDVVLNGEDPMKQGREDFYKQYLLPPNGKSVAENTMDVFLKTFC